MTAHIATWYGWSYHLTCNLLNVLGCFLAIWVQCITCYLALIIKGYTIKSATIYNQLGAPMITDRWALVLFRRNSLVFKSFHWKKCSKSSGQCNRDKEQSVTGDMEKRVGTEVLWGHVFTVMVYSWAYEWNMCIICGGIINTKVQGPNFKSASKEIFHFHLLYHGWGIANVF